MKKIILILVVSILALSGLGAVALPNEKHIENKSLNTQDWLSDNIWESNNLMNPNPENIFMQLDINGISYGHELLWKANTTGTNYEESAVAYIDGVAYIGSCSTHGKGHDKLFAVNTTNGEIIWSTYTGPGYVGPVIDNDVIYFGTSSHGQNPDDEYMYAFDRHTGSEIWNVSIYGGIAESVQFDDKKIYFGSSDGGETVYALNKVDGSINWTYNTGLYDCANKPMLKDNALYAAYFDYIADVTLPRHKCRGFPSREKNAFGVLSALPCDSSRNLKVGDFSLGFTLNSSVGELFKLNATDGSEIWRISLPEGPWDNSITADGEGRIFLAILDDRSMNAYSENDGSLLWTYPLHGYPFSFNAYHNGVVFIADSSGYVYAFDSTDGTLLWENKIGDTIDISSPTLSGGLLFIGTRDGSKGAFFALNETTGDVLWKYTIGSSVTAPPSIVDGMMLCGADDWYMYAFDFGVGSGNWTLHRYDSHNTAYSPYGLTTWQYVEADCTTDELVTTCIVTNYYDRDVTNITLKLPFRGDWYNQSGDLLKSDSDNYMIDSLSSLSSMTFIIQNTQNTQDWLLSIWIDGKLSGYEVSVTNVGNESVTGNLTLNITTDAWIMLVGETLEKELAFEVDPEAEGIRFKMGSVFGFGPATITIEGVFKPTGDDDYPFEAEIRGFVLLSFVTSFATNIIIP